MLISQGKLSCARLRVFVMSDLLRRFDGCFLLAEVRFGVVAEFSLARRWPVEFTVSCRGFLIL